MRKEISERTQQIERDIRSLEKTYEVLKTLYDEGRMDEFSSLATDAALRSEYLTCKMRHLLYQCAALRKPEYLVRAAEVQGMTVKAYPDMYEIELPGLLPKRKQRVSSEFLIDPLYYMLEHFSSKYHIKRYDGAVVCFVYEYDSRLPTNRVRDYDNIEKKQVLDVLTTFFLVDDSGICCETFNMTAIGNADKTRILIMPRERFVTWIAEMQEL